MNAKERNVLIAKYIFLALVALNIINSVWVIVHDRMRVVEAQEKYPEDWYTGQKGEGYYAKYWFIACIVVMVLNDLLSLGAFFGVYRESSQVVMIYSSLMFVVAVYCAWDKYITRSVSGFVLPLLTGLVGLLYASLNHIRIYEGSTLPGVSVQYVSNSKPLASPTIQPYRDEPYSTTTYSEPDDEVEKLKQPDV